MWGEFKGDDQNDSGVNGQPYEPVAAAVTLSIDSSLAENEVQDDSDDGRLEHAFNQPGEVIPVVEDAILLSDEVDFGE